MSRFRVTQTQVQLLLLHCCHTYSCLPPLFDASLANLPYSCLFPFTVAHCHCALYSSVTHVSLLCSHCCTHTARQRHTPFKFQIPTHSPPHCYCGSVSLRQPSSLYTSAAAKMTVASMVQELQYSSMGHTAAAAVYNVLATLSSVQAITALTAAVSTLYLDT